MPKHLIWTFNTLHLASILPLSSQTVALVILSMHSTWNPDLDSSLHSPTSSDSSFDEEEVNRRITPRWQSYGKILKAQGFRLDTVRDVKEFYKRCSESRPLGYLRACENADDDALCPDAGLVSTSISKLPTIAYILSLIIYFEGLGFAMVKRLWSRLSIYIVESMMLFDF